MQQRRNLYRHLIVNEEHKVIYCQIPKVACTQVKRIFQALNGNYQSVYEVKSVDILPFTYLEDKKFSEEQRRYMLKNFYKFMIVRDPIERLVSAYRNKLEDKSNPGMLLKELSKKMRKLFDARRQGYNKTKTAAYYITFPEFIHHIIETPLHELNQHWMPFNDLCRPCDIQYDFIGSLDNLKRDTTYVMKKVKLDETKYYVKKTIGSVKQTTRKSTANFLKDVPKDHFDRLVKMLQLDFELFGYSLPEFDSLDERYPSR